MALERTPVSAHLDTPVTPSLLSLLSLYGFPRRHERSEQSGCFENTARNIGSVVMRLAHYSDRRIVR